MLGVMRYLARLMLAAMLAACGDSFEEGGATGGAGGNDGGAAATGGSAGAGAGGATGGGAGQGGSVAVCGDGVIGDGEECDDANDVADDGCASCQVDCGTGGVEDPATHHCYWEPVENLIWTGAQGKCNARGGDLVGISSAAELAFIVKKALVNRWTGGKDLLGDESYIWINGEPFDFDNWNVGRPNTSAGIDCIFLNTSAKFETRSCTAGGLGLCERHPPVKQ